MNSIAKGFSGDYLLLHKLIIVAIYDLYANELTTDPPQIKKGFQLLEEYTAHMSFSEQERICSTASMLCAEQDHSAFLNGLRVGAQLILELLA